MEDTDSGKGKTKQPREKRLNEGGLSSMKRIDKSRAAEYKDLLTNELANPTQDPLPFDFDVDAGCKLFRSEKDQQAVKTNEKNSKEISKDITQQKDVTSSIMGITDASYRVLMPGRMISLPNNQKKMLQTLQQETPTDATAIESFIKTLDGEGIMTSTTALTGEKIEEFRHYDPILSMLDSMWILEHTKGSSITPETRYVWCYKVGYRVEKPNPMGGKPINVIIVTWIPVPTERLKKACAKMMDLVRKKEASLYCKVTFKHEAPEGPRARTVVFPRVPICYFRNQIFLDAWSTATEREGTSEKAGNPTTTQLNVNVDEEAEVQEMEEDVEQELQVDQADAPNPSSRASKKDAMDELLDSIDDEAAAAPAPEPHAKKKGGRPKKQKPDQPNEVAEKPKPKEVAKKPKQATTTVKKRFYDDEAKQDADTEPAKRKRAVKGQGAKGSKKRRIDLVSSDEEDEEEDEEEEEPEEEEEEDDEDDEYDHDDPFINDGPMTYESGADDDDDDDYRPVSVSEDSVVSDSASESEGDGEKDDSYVSSVFTRHLERVSRKLEDTAAKGGFEIKPPITANDTWETILRDHYKFSHLVHIWLLMKFNPTVSLFGGDGSDRPKTTEDIVRELLGGPRRRPDPVTERKILEMLGK